VCPVMEIEEQVCPDSDVVVLEEPVKKKPVRRRRNTKK